MMQVRGAVVSGRTVSIAVGKWSNMRTEWNVRFEAEAPLQAVMEREEDEKAETVSAGDPVQGR